ncbi:MAG: hypothetical protein WCY58_10795 [Mariniphaga sp.]|nr:hypothetical protein [Mariniphaga sp.]
MIIRATAKLHNIARMKPVKNESVITGSLPGEWYASLLSTGRKGGSAMHFLHNPTMISVIVLGRSISKSLEVFPMRVASLLDRNGFSKLVPGFELDTEPEIYATNSRNILANMNQMRFNIEFHLAMSENLDLFDIARNEDLHLEYLFGGKVAGDRSYIRPVDHLNELLQ